MVALSQSPDASPDADISKGRVLPVSELFPTDDVEEKEDSERLNQVENGRDHLVNVDVEEVVCVYVEVDVRNGAVKHRAEHRYACHDVDESELRLLPS